ncbi:hypothetical protein JY96_13430 [Aquabacterium sp. NJ1]|uniref:FAD:protein FMN transferase n=1 Tax=Aquabacterium sp. NJ1 TaxID=1538295 RepID=UPI00052BE848|nr:FAD:protein FMN transferase [Aquabacterium sp. NJ1]KGM40707.1 hypothetical protein JY96_13430 [Aquabacterium sp. NJ1]
MKQLDDELGVRFLAMGCGGDIRLAGVPMDEARALAELAIREVLRIEYKYSRYRSDSIVSQINAAAGNGEFIVLDDETAQLMAYADKLWDFSEGLFDITSGVLRRAWDFKSGRVPSTAQLEALRPLVGWRQLELVFDVQISSTSVRLTRPGMEIDFGGFGKEYAADRAAALLMGKGVRHGYVNLGGDIRLMGPRPDGEPWDIGVAHPREADHAIATMKLSSGAMATSGDYERYMDVDGHRYCHILHPWTLMPVMFWRSISVVSSVCSAAGALSTIAMLKQDQAPAFLRSQGVTWLGVDQSGQVCRGAP